MYAQVSGQVTGDAQVIGRVGTIGGEPNLKNSVGLLLKPGSSGNPQGGSGRQHQNATMVMAYPQFIWCADHALRGHTFYLALADGKELTVFAEHLGAGQRHEHRLADGHIGRAAHDGTSHAMANIHLRGGEMVGVGNTLASGDQTGHDLLQIYRRGLYGLPTFHFQPQRGQYIGNFRGRFMQVEIISYPIQRNLHFLKVTFGLSKVVTGYRLIVTGVVNIWLLISYANI